MTPAEGIERLINERDAALARAAAAEAAHRAEQRLTASSWRAAQAYVQRIGELEAELAALAAVRQHGCDCSDDDACAFARRAMAAEAALARCTRERDRARAWMEKICESYVRCSPCPMWYSAGDGPDCGLDAALADEPEEVEP